MQSVTVRKTLESRIKQTRSKSNKYGSISAQTWLASTATFVNASFYYGADGAMPMTISKHSHETDLHRDCRSYGHLNL